MSEAAELAASFVEQPPAPPRQTGQDALRRAWADIGYRELAERLKKHGAGGNGGVHRQQDKPRHAVAIFCGSGWGFNWYWAPSDPF